MSDGMATIIALLGIAYIGLACNVAAQRIESLVIRTTLLITSTAMVVLIATLTIRMLLGTN